MSSSLQGVASTSADAVENDSSIRQAIEDVLARANLDDTGTTSAEDSSEEPPQPQRKPLGETICAVNA